MAAERPVHDPALGAFLTEAGKVPLLDHEQEVVLGRALRERHREFELMLLGAPYTWRKVLAWEGLVRAGELDAAELMLRGRKTRAQVAGMRRRLGAACRLLRRALKDPGAYADRAVAALDALALNRKRLLGLVDALRADLARRPPVEGRGELVELAHRLAEARERIAEARTALVEANIRLAVSVAKRFSHATMDFADLVQEGTLGLMKAADRYDERLGYKFSTYATWWVRQSIQRAIADKASTIRQPAHVQGVRERVRRAANRYRDRTGREPSTEELARGLRLKPELLRAAVDTSQEPMSLTEDSSELVGPPLEERLPDEAAPSPLAAVKTVLQADELEAALGRLTAREAHVLRMRFGLGFEPMTLEAAGRRLGLTRERVRQIERRAILKLKASRFSGRLRDYWENGR